MNNLYRYRNRVHSQENGTLVTNWGQTTPTDSVYHDVRYEDLTINLTERFEVLRIYE